MKQNCLILKNNDEIRKLLMKFTSQLRASKRELNVIITIQRLPDFQTAGSLGKIHHSELAGQWIFSLYCISFNLLLVKATAVETTTSATTDAQSLPPKYTKEENRWLKHVYVWERERERDRQTETDRQTKGGSKSEDFSRNWRHHPDGSPHWSLLPDSTIRQHITHSA